MPTAATATVNRTGSVARTRLIAAAALGLVVGVGLAFSPLVVAAPLSGWVTAVVVFVAWTWMEVWPKDGEATEAHARRKDPTRPMADLACLAAAIASLVAVGVLLIGAGNAKGATKLLEIGLSIAAVIAAWAMIHTVFALRYAETYFATGKGSIDFNDDDPPCYSDFAYLALTVGLTFQVSDTDLRSSGLRRLAIRHMLLSYLMGAVIIAATINLVAGMTK